MVDMDRYGLLGVCVCVCVCVCMCACVYVWAHKCPPKDSKMSYNVENSQQSTLGKQINKHIQ